MVEKKEMKFQARINDEESKKLIDETLIKIKEAGHADSVGQALAYVFEQFNRTTELDDKALGHMFAGELMELKQWANRVPELFLQMINKAQQEINNTKRSTGTLLKEKEEVLEEQQSVIAGHDEEIKKIGEEHNNIIEEIKQEHATEIEGLNNKIKKIEELLREKEETSKLKDVEIHSLIIERDQKIEENEKLRDQLMVKEQMVNNQFAELNETREELKGVREEAKRRIEQGEKKVEELEKQNAELQREKTEILVDIIKGNKSEVAATSDVKKNKK